MEAPPAAWGPDEILRFYRAYHKYGTEFDKVSKMVGGGKARDMCEALWRRHQAYLSLDRKFQSEVAFVAMVQDSAHKALTGDASEGDSGVPASAAAGAAATGTGQLDDDQLSGDSADIGAQRPRVLQSNRDAEEDGDDDEEAEQDGEGEEAAAAAAAVVAMASPGGNSQGTLASNRSRRTPKRAAGHRSPQSTTKRSRGGARAGGDDIYAYYDEGAQSMSESARKRRAPVRKTLDFESHPPAPTRRRDEADEAKGIDALLALAVATSEGEEEEPAAAAADATAAAADEEETDEEISEEDEEEPPMEDDEEDEDYELGAEGGRGRRTPHSTPGKGRSRPGSSHVTPRRGAGRAGASPGGLRSIGSPGWLGGGDDFLGDLQAMGDAPYLASPGFAPQLPAGFVASPQNPMPRLRRRKHAPETAPILMSPIKSLFHRRQALPGSSVLSVAALGFAGDEPGDGHAATPEEARLRHCLTARARRWAMFEFFYNALDRAFYLDGSLSDLAEHVGLPRDARLTRREWSALRSALGRPRRLSWRFLRDERARLEKWRAEARERYGAGAEADTSKDAHMPRMLGVGQRVTARHPTTRQLHDGAVLTVAPDCYRVQFDRRELGVELVRDIDIMPHEPWANLPPAVLAARPRLVMNSRLVLNGQAVPAQRLPSRAAVKQEPLHGGAGRLGGPQARVIVPDAMTMSELATSLDKKEALLVQLRHMNDEAQAGLHTDAATGAANPQFAQSYAQVVLRLKEINDSVQARLVELERGGVGAAGVAVLADDPGAPPPGSALPPELRRLNGAITVGALAASALNEARRVVQTCRGNMAGGDEQVGENGGGRGGIDWSTPEGAMLGGVIEGAVWSLVMLQQGADRLVPAAVLAAALDTSLQSVKPKAEANQALFAELEEAMQALKLQLTASAAT